MSEPSTNAVAPLDAMWVERIFMRMHGRFGNHFFERFRTGQLTKTGEDVGVHNAKIVWGEDLAGFSIAEIRRGLEAKYKYPPSCDDFVAACRPDNSLSIEARLHLAIDCMISRRNCHPENWPDNRTFWAAQSIGGDITILPVGQLKARWAASYELAANRAHVPIPPTLPKEQLLPAPGKTTISKEDAKARISKILNGIGR